jgi:hypothetical protein
MQQDLFKISQIYFEESLNHLLQAIVRGFLLVFNVCTMILLFLLLDVFLLKSVLTPSEWSHKKRMPISFYFFEEVMKSMNFLLI